MCACVRIGLRVGGGAAPPSGLGGGVSPPPRGPRGGAPRCPPRSSGWAGPFPAAGPGCWAPRGAGGAGLPLRVCFRRGGAFAPPRGARQRCSGPAHLGHKPPPPPLGFSFTPGFFLRGVVGWGGAVAPPFMWTGRRPLHVGVGGGARPLPLVARMGVVGDRRLGDHRMGSYPKAFALPLWRSLPPRVSGGGVVHRGVAPLGGASRAGRSWCPLPRRRAMRACDSRRGLSLLFEGWGLAPPLAAGYATGGLPPGWPPGRGLVVVPSPTAAGPDWLAVASAHGTPKVAGLGLEVGPPWPYRAARVGAFLTWLPLARPVWNPQPAGEVPVGTPRPSLLWRGREAGASGAACGAAPCSPFAVGAAGLHFVLSRRGRGWQGLMVASAMWACYVDSAVGCTSRWSRAPAEPCSACDVEPCSLEPCSFEPRSCELYTFGVPLE